MNQFALLLSLCTATLAAHIELCPEDDKAEFISTQLDSACAGALTRLQFIPPPPPNITAFTLPPFNLTEISDEDLDIACQSSCRGSYSTWLRTNCNDIYTARSIDAMCENTAGTSNVLGSRCRFGFPDGIDARLIFRNVFTRCNFSMPNACVAETQTGDNSQRGDEICAAFRALSDIYGCCFNSLYNNSEFVNYLSGSTTRVLNDFMAEVTLNFGRSPVWDQCMIDVPEMCSASALSSALCAVPTTASVLILALIPTVLFMLQ